MKIEPIRKFPKIKSVFPGSLLCCPDLDRMLTLDYDFRKLTVCSMSTGKELGVQRLPRYHSFRSIRRVGKWLFVECDGGGTSYGLYDLEKLLYHELEGAFGKENKFISFAGGAGSSILFHNSVLDEISKSYILRLPAGDYDGSLPTPLPFACVWTAGWTFWFGAMEKTTESFYGTFRLDENGVPTGEKLGELEAHQALLAIWEDRLLFSKVSEDGVATIECRNSTLATVYRFQLPPPAETSSPKDWPRAVLVRGKECERLLIWRQVFYREIHRVGKLRRRHLTGIDRDTGEVLWTREIESLDFRDPFPLDGHYLLPDPEGFTLIDVDTGELRRIHLPNHMAFSGNGYYLGESGYVHGGAVAPEEVPYLFWQTEPDKPVMMGRLVG